jgi:hypothetical protein
VRARQAGRLLAANLLGNGKRNGRSARRRRRRRGRAGQYPGRRSAVELFGKDVVCQIGIPVVAIETGRAASDRLAKATCRVNLLTEEGYALAVALTAQGGA